MSDFTVDKKLQLVQQVRSQYDRNQYDLQNRERILYGKTQDIYRGIDGDVNPYAPLYGGEEDSAIPVHFSTFKLRLVVSIMLLLGILVLDRTGGAFFGIQAKDVFTFIQEDFSQTAIQLIQGIL